MMDDEQESLLLQREEEDESYRHWIRWFGLPLRSSNGYMYLRLHHLLIFAFLLLSLILVPVLLPIYVTGDNRVAHGTTLQHASAGNVPLASPKLWVVFVCVVIVVVVVFYVVSAFLSTLKARYSVRSLKMRSFHSHMSSKARAIEAFTGRTVHVQGLSVRCVYEDELFEYFNKRFPGEVEFVYIAKDMTNLSELVKQKEAAEVAIERAILLESKTGERVRHGGCCGFCDNTDTLRFSEALRDRLTRQIEAAMREKRLGTGHAFIVFKHPPELAQLYEPGVRQGLQCCECLKSFGERQGRELNVEDWTFEMAPLPSDILWDNLSVSKGQQLLRFVVFNFALFLLMVVIIAPVSVLDRLTPLLKSVEDSIAENERDPARVLVTNYAPPLVVLLINSLLLPFLIDIVSHLECHHRESQRMQSVFRKNLIFLFLNVIVIPTLALNSISAFLHLSYNTKWSQWQQIIGHVFLSSSGSFFVQYLIHATFLGGGAQLLDLGQEIWRYWMLRTAVTEQRIAEANEIWQFDFGYWSSVRLTMFGLVLVYSVAVPIILPFGLLYFYLVELVDRRNFVEGVYSLSWEDGGVLATSVARTLLLYTALFLLVNSSFFLVQSTAGSDFFALGCLLLVMLCACLFVYCTQVFAPPIIEIKENLRAAAQEEAERARQRGDEVVDVGAFQLYVHPLNRDEVAHDGGSRL